MNILSVLSSFLLCFLLAVLAGEEASADPVQNGQKIQQNPARELFLEGFAYAHGRGVPENEEKALACYEKAREAGYAPATYNAARIYLLGNAALRNEEKAFQYFREAAEQGLMLAQYSLASLYEEGRGTDKNMERAVYWYGKAADQGDAWAQYRLGSLFEEGKNVARDLTKAAEWYTKSADQGNTAALNNLAILYEMGLGGLGKNTRLAFRLYHRAARSGNAVAQYNVARCYREGVGVAKNPGVAFAWEARAKTQTGVQERDLPATGASRSGRNKILAVHIRGIDPERRVGLRKEKNSERTPSRETVRSRKTEQKARDLFQSGRAYENGSSGRQKDLKKAIELYQNAANLHYAPAAFHLACLYANDASLDAHERNAWKWFNEAAANGHRDAQYRLAECYEKGIGIPRNRSMALYWYSQAGAAGDKKASAALTRLQHEELQKTD